MQTLLETPTVQLHDVCCPGLPVEPTEDEFTSDLRLVFPYRGVYVRHVGTDEAVAEANQVLFFNPDEGYQVSHPVAGGDACLSLTLQRGAGSRAGACARCCATAPRLAFRQQRLRIDARAQVLVALLRHSPLREGIAEPLEAEGLALTLVRSRAGTAHHSCARRAAPARRALVDRVKSVMAGRTGAAMDPGRDRRRGRPLAGLPDASVPAGRGPAALPLSAPPPPRPRARPARPVRRPHRRSASTSASPATATSALGVHAGLWPVALRVPPGGSPPQLDSRILAAAKDPGSGSPAADGLLLSPCM